MAVIDINFRSQLLKMNTSVTICLPEPDFLEHSELPDKKVLWLLHGLGDDSRAWHRFSMIDYYAAENDVVVIMPSGYRSMYCDNIYGQNYFSYIVHELPRYMQKILKISGDREKNYIAGFSMGGLGAMKAALTYPKKYRAVGSFCGLLDFAPMLAILNKEMKNDFAFLLSDIDNVDRSPNNPAALLNAAKDKDLEIYIASGMQDDMLLTNYSFKKRADALGVKVDSVFEEGKHNWDFSNKHVKIFIEKYMKQISNHGGTRQNEKI